MPPGLLYVFVSLLVPEDSSAVDSWKEHFFKVRLRLFLTAIAWDITAFMGLILSHRVGTPSILIFGALFITHSVGALSSEPKLHALLATVPPAMVAVSGLTVFFQPMQ